MLGVFFYFLLIFLELVLAFSLMVYALSLLFSSFMGAPYVPTNMKEIELILKEARLKKGQRFIELGCGDGRVTCMAVKKYGVRGLGIDINPTFVYLSRLKAWLQKIEQVEFRVQNVFDVSIKDFHIIYMFLMPEMITSLKDKLKTVEKGTMIISHGFKIKDWDDYMIKTLQRKPFPTYYYRV